MTTDPRTPTTPRALADFTQGQASDPTSHVWLAANAGTGKTKVLTDRFLRLLLPLPDGSYDGCAPDKILAITFTKAAAAEMKKRIVDVAASWCVMNDEELTAALSRLTGFDADARMLRAARGAFARLLDCPGGLRIVTIHSFCQSVLARFPLEAGLSPHARVIEERQAQEFLAKARDDIWADDALKAARRAVLSVISPDQADTAIAGLMRERSVLDRACKALQDDPFYYHRLLGIAPGLDAESAAQAARDDLLPFVRDAYSAARDARGKKIKDAADILADLIAGPKHEATAFMNILRTALYKKTEDALFSEWDKLAAGNVELRSVLDQIVAGLDNYRQQVVALTLAPLNAALIELAGAVATRFARFKAREGAIDFDDLITFTARLLAARPSWVLYKLDGGIDHVLLDEAQDTNPDQWAVIDALIDDFFSGDSSHARGRSLFVVGDEKQSIYRFQRANPRLFQRKRRAYQNRAVLAGAPWRDLPLNVSFRSAKAVLDVVDTIFTDPVMALAATGDTAAAPISHLCDRENIPGRVDVLPLIPFADDSGETPVARQARQVASVIDGWLRTGVAVPKTGNAITPGDILIVVRNRGPFVDQLIKALHFMRIPSSGADRLVVTDALSVRDLIVCADWALYPVDDLALATLLKTPFIGMDEDALQALCYGRPADLWSRLRLDPAHANITAYLEDIQKAARELSPYDFFSFILDTPCPGCPRGTGRQALHARLGAAHEDPVDEFLTMALTAGSVDHATLQSFMEICRSQSTEIKRDMDDTAGVVRIMTVHASKGLQAPVVIVADCNRSPLSRHNPTLVYLDGSGDQPAMPLYSPRTQLHHPVFTASRIRFLEDEKAENGRLLYVAATRAQDYLVVCGMAVGKNDETGHAESWYTAVKRTVSALPGAVLMEDGAWRYEQNGGLQAMPVSPGVVSSEAPLPAWAVASHCPDEPLPPTPLVPSRPASTPATLSPARATERDNALERGILVHRLLQFLPDIPGADQQIAALNYLAKAAPFWDGAQQSAIVDDVLRVIDNPDYAALFGPGSYAEVPVTAMIDARTRLSGQIDRLLVTDNLVVVVDYKTGRPPVDDAAIPPAYRRQMMLYAQALSRIYPGRKIESYLLWVEGPVLMKVSFDQEVSARVKVA